MERRNEKRARRSKAWLSRNEKGMQDRAKDTHTRARTYTQSHTHTRAGHKSMSRCPVELPLPLCPASCTRARTSAPTKQLSKCLSKCRRGVRERHSGTDRLSGTVGRTVQVKGRDRRQAQDRIVGRTYNVFKHVKKKHTHTHSIYSTYIALRL